VAIQPETGTAAEGQIFQTEGIDFDAPKATKGDWQDGPQLLARFDAPLGRALVHMGGERRLAAMKPEEKRVWPASPNAWAKKAIRDGGLSLTLLTPGIFGDGYRPSWLKQNLTGSPPNALSLKLKLIAAAVDRWQPHSGWDLPRQQPRPSRKLVPRGATYWFRIQGDAEPDSLNALWLTNISDLEQDRLDGFGLALPIPWTPTNQSTT